MNDDRKLPFICRRILGLRPGQWLILIGVAMMVVPSIIYGRNLRIGQWLILVGAIGLLLVRIFLGRK